MRKTTVLAVIFMFLFSSVVMAFTPYMNEVKDGRFPIESVNKLRAKVMLNSTLNPVGMIRYGTLFYIGTFLSFYVHELGHQIVSDASDGTQRWVGGWLPGDIKGKYTGSKKEQMGVAGFMFMNCYSEILMNQSPRSPFTIGVVLFNIFHNFGYILKDNQTPGGFGDFSNFRKPGERERIKRAVALHTSWVALRLILGEKMNYLPTIELRNGVPFYMYYKTF